MARVSSDKAVVLIRLLVGWVFVSEGIQKFLFPASVGAGRFAKIGIPMAASMASLVGTVEIVCGLLLIVGLLTRVAAVPLLVVISTAIVTTKIPMLLGHAYWGLSLSKLDQYGFWSMLHEARTDFSMFLGLVFLLLVGAGDFSLDRRFFCGNHQARGE
ncbi:MAG TPA: DoxX family protein [Terriglobales bacterium]|jgi:uncharacterized membrane protein YphA (DoxX/SURF4 family)|nr:DoxX family protein [Terriglobales bacterium]